MSGIHNFGDVFIVGLGWIDPESVKCVKCGDRGYLVTAWDDSGDAESGPKEPTPSDGYFCDCEVGVKLAVEDADESVGHIMSQLSGDRTSDIELLLNEGVITTLADSSLWTGWTDSAEEEFKASVERFIRTKVSGNQLEARHRANDLRVHRVWWCFGTEIAMTYSDDQESGEVEGYRDGRYDDHRIGCIQDRIYELAKAQWPNATDWDITNGGFENNYARFSARVEFEDGESLDGGMDALQGFEEQAVSEAWERWPEDTDDTDLRVYVKPGEYGFDAWSLMLVTSHLDDARKNAERYIANGYTATRVTDGARSGWEEVTHEPERTMMSFTHGDPQAITRAVANATRIPNPSPINAGKYPMTMNPVDLQTVLYALQFFGESGHHPEMCENASSLYSGILQTLGVEVI